MHITAKDGLPSHDVTDIIQDDKGRLWIGTANGLALYDGFDIQTYFKSDKDNSINHNAIKSLFQDSQKNIWVATYDGICKYLPQTNDFKRYILSRPILSSIAETSEGELVCAGQELYSYNRDSDKFDIIKRNDEEFILSLATDKKNRLFASTNRSIFYFHNSFKNVTQLSSSFFADFLTGFDGVVPLFFDSNNCLWIGRNGKGVMKLDLETNQSKIYDQKLFSNSVVQTISEDNNHRILLGTEGGISILNYDGSIDLLKQRFMDESTLNDNVVNKIFFDKDDNIWVATRYGGINFQLNKGGKFGWIEPGYGETNLKGKILGSIIQPYPNELWIAAENGAGINIFNTETKEITVFDKIPDIKQRVQSLYFDKDNSEVWIGTFRNGLFCYNLKTKQYKNYQSDPYGLPTNAVFALAMQKNGKLWVGTTMGVRCFDRETQTFSKVDFNIIDFDFCFSLCVDNKDNVWVGTRNMALYCIKENNGEIISWPKGEEMRDNFITSIYQDSKNLIYVGTNNNGLQCINPDSMSIIKLNNDLSLLQQTICSIIEDNDNSLWVSTNTGLYKINKERTNYSHFMVEDGLPVNQFNFQSAFHAQNNFFYMGSTSGIVYFDPHVIESKHPIFNICLKSLTIDNEIQSLLTKDTPLRDELDKMDKLTLSYSQSRWFSIEYSSITLSDAKNIFYQVELEGINSGWKDVGKDRKFVFHNLPSGDYKLRLRANNANTNWDIQPIKEIEIEILPPFYKSSLAYLIYFILLMIAGYAVYKFSLIRMSEKNMARMANLEVEKMNELNNMKLDFFSLVSHELRTPLSLIVAPLRYIMQHNNLPQDSVSKLSVAINNTNKMLGLIDELVTFNKVESGTFSFFIQKGNPLKFIDDLASLYNESIKDKNLSLYINCEDNGELVWFSPSYVERIVNNLLSNALKFTLPTGKVYVNAKLEDSDDGFTYLVISVKDTGIGIAKSELQNIFTEHYQTKRGYNKNNKGWGLGLSIVKTLTSVHKGIITVESEEGKGSLFVVKLNVSENAFDSKTKLDDEKLVVLLNRYEFSVESFYNSKTTKDVDSKKTIKESKQTILLVEDNDELLKLLSDIFSKNYNVFTAENGKDALDIAFSNPVDIVVSDIMMPVMDGNILCRSIKNDIITSHIPIILLTAKSDIDTMKQGFESGAEAYIQKPFDPSILELQVKNILKARSLQRENLINSQGSDVESTSLSPFDKDFINKINEIIDKNIDNNNFSVSDITSNLGISRSLLHVKMKSLLNISTGDYIRKKRFIKAKDLLVQGYNVSEVAYMSGFTDPNYFSKSFKKEFNITPSEYVLKNKN